MEKRISSDFIKELAENEILEKSISPVSWNVKDDFLDEYTPLMEKVENAAQAANKGGGHPAALSWQHLWLSC